MQYEKPEVEVVKFEDVGFMTFSYHETPLGNYTCGSYQQGTQCNNISWNATGYSCGVYTGEGHCQSVYSPPGSMGDGCHAWKLTCSKF